jgi:hypothetical protein
MVKDLLLITLFTAVAMAVWPHRGGLEQFFTGVAAGISFLAGTRLLQSIVKAFLSVLVVTLAICVFSICLDLSIESALHYCSRLAVGFTSGFCFSSLDGDFIGRLIVILLGSVLLAWILFMAVGFVFFGFPIQH